MFFSIFVFQVVAKLSLGFNGMLQDEVVNTVDLDISNILYFASCFSAFVLTTPKLKQMPQTFLDWNR